MCVCVGVREKLNENIKFGQILKMFYNLPLRQPLSYSSLFIFPLTSHLPTPTFFPWIISSINHPINKFIDFHQFFFFRLLLLSPPQYLHSPPFTLLSFPSGKRTKNFSFIIIIISITLKKKQKNKKVKVSQRVWEIKRERERESERRKMKDERKNRFGNCSGIYDF